MPDFVVDPKKQKDTASPGQQAAAPSLFSSDDETLKPPTGKSTDAPKEIKGFGKDTSDALNTHSGFHRKGEVNVYAEQLEARYKMDSRKRALIIMTVILIIILPLVMVMPYGLGDSTTGFTPAAYVTSFQRNLHDFFALFTDPASSGSHSVIVCRYLCIAFAGAGLGITGAVYQGSLKNALASPSTLGVMSGATLGGVVFILFLGGAGSGLVDYAYKSASDVAAQIASLPWYQYLWFAYGKAFCMLVGSFAAIGFVLLIAKIAGRGKTSSVWLIVAGQILAVALGSITSLVQYYYQEAGDTMVSEAIQNMSAQAFTYSTSLTDVLMVGVPVTVCIIIVICMRSKLGLLSFSEEEARSMGINTTRTRNTMIAICTFMTAIITAFCGSVGFLGFLVPHITRRAIGPDFKYLVPASALVGALILLITYYAMSLLSATAANYVGTVTSLIGFIVFIVMIIRRKGTDHDGWI